FLKEITALFVKVLMLARQMGVLQLGTVALDGTKIHANASRHSALSYEHAGKLEAQLKAEVGTLLAKAEAADQADIPDGMSIPEELERREARLKKLAEARAKIEARASERLAREQAEYETKMAAREVKARAPGKKPGGKPRRAAGTSSQGLHPSRSASKTSRESDNRPSEKDHLEPAIGSRRVRASGNAAAQRAAIAQNPCAPKRSKIGPQARVRRAVAIPMPTVP